jgi:hypothetical protein
MRPGTSVAGASMNVAEAWIPRCLTTGRSSATSAVPNADSNCSFAPVTLIISGVACSTSNPASASRSTARVTTSASDMKSPTVVASALRPGSKSDVPPSECGEASAKIRSGKRGPRRDLLERLDAMLPPARSVTRLKR